MQCAPGPIQRIESDLIDYSIDCLLDLLFDGVSGLREHLPVVLSRNKLERF